MHDLAQQRCFNHANREAAAQCPECSRYFCRECVTEHEGRVLCASCLNRLAAPSTRRAGGVGFLVQLGQIALGILVLWVVFSLLGRGLLALPSEFHDGTFLKVPLRVEEK